VFGAGHFLTPLMRNEVRAGNPAGRDIAEKTNQNRSGTTLPIDGRRPYKGYAINFIIVFNGMFKITAMPFIIIETNNPYLMPIGSLSRFFIIFE
jgi:hypothetical protein